jgi:hypothetical protein
LVLLVGDWNVGMRMVCFGAEENEGSIVRRRKESSKRERASGRRFALELQTVLETTTERIVI